MRYVCPAIMVALSSFIPAIYGQAGTPAPAAKPTLSVMDATVGQNLEAAAMVTFDGPPSPTGLEITLTSKDPGLLLLSATPDGVGSASIVVKLPSSAREMEVYLQGLAKSGTATYTASAPGVEGATGTVTLMPSGIVIGGPYGVGKGSFMTTTGAGKTTITVFSAVLDAALNYRARQQLAGGRSVEVKVATSNPAVGTLSSSTVKLKGGSNNGTLLFQPTHEGDTTLTVTPPAGFDTPAQAQFTKVNGKVAFPGMVVTEDITLGQNLQDGGYIGLNEPAPAGGLVVKLTCHNPGQLLLSSSATEKGSDTLTVKIPAGANQGSFFLQAVGGSGQVTYTATAPGYHDSRPAVIKLAPSGVVIAGPLSFTRSGKSPGFVTSLSSHKPTPIVVYTVFLDPVTHRSADVTVQPLRAGVSLTVTLISSDPSVGTVASPLIIKANTNQARTLFTPLKPGATVLSPVTPEGYTESANAVALKAIVTE